MSADGKVKTYKNPNRDKGTDYKPYVPQYVVEGVEPREFKSAMVSSNTKIATPQPLPLDNPRGRRPALRQPYAQTTTSPIGRGKGPVPNVGNNMEHTWPNVDGDIIDDLSGEPVDPNQSMIDNNDEVSELAFNLPFRNGATAKDLVPQNPYSAHVTVEHEVQAVRQPLDDTNNLLPIVADLDEGSYLLIVSGVPICSGPLEEIQDQARALVFGEHELCDGNPVPDDDIIILKRVKVKVGLFLE